MKNEISKKENQELELIPSMGLVKSEESLPEVVEVEPISKPISVDLSQHLLNIAKKITSEGELTPEKVLAACKCGDVIYKILDLKFRKDLSKPS